MFEGVRPFAVIRADASPSIGGGHVMRCLALAHALSADGWRVGLAGTAITFATVPLPAEIIIERFELSDAYDPLELMALISSCDLLIVDHYGLGATYELACRPWCKRILVIDDLADRRHDCDLLLDQTLGRAVADYSGLVPLHCTMMTGTAYALLRPKFSAVRLTLPVVGPLRRVVLALGTTDPTRLLPGAIVAMRAALPNAELVVVVGSSAPHHEEISQAVQTAGAVLYSDVLDMAELLVQADLVVAAAGSITWELCALARPMVLVQSVANQTNNVAAMQAARAAVVSDLAGLETVVRSLAADDALRARIAAAAGILCDGRGAQRVAMNVCPEYAADGAPVTLRPATMNDAMMVLEWQRSPETRRFAREPAVPSEAEHLVWMTRCLSDPGCLFNIILHDGAPTGVVRLNHLASQCPVAFEVSIFVAPKKYRLHLGRAALNLARRLVPEAVLNAQVHLDNAASRALFLSVGYRLEENWYRQYPLVLESA